MGGSDDGGGGGTCGCAKRLAAPEGSAGPDAAIGAAAHCISLCPVGASCCSCVARGGEQEAWSVQQHVSELMTAHASSWPVDLHSAACASPHVHACMCAPACACPPTALLLNTCTHKPMLNALQCCMHALACTAHAHVCPWLGLVAGSFRHAPCCCQSPKPCLQHAAACPHQRACCQWVSGQHQAGLGGPLASHCRCCCCWSHGAQLG